ncbi:MAG: Stp1/IreP family PP2C-type Ser/Thr phosphatase [Deltaproteobacteria bacterium]|nr:Stp1/IreP family PP2C-type Ser/Thr phosphatase [Deltaproteobacteria bacterium]
MNAIRSWGLTDVGKRRDHNEDSFFVDEDLKLYVVADGMGGHAAGEVASRMAQEHIHKKVKEGKEAIDRLAQEDSPINREAVLKLLEAGVQDGCKAIHDLSEKEPERKGMGTTTVCLLLVGEHGFFAHVGDSRLYLIRGGNEYQLTTDHSLVNEQIRQGKLDPAKADKVPYANVITRAVGVYESVEVDTQRFEVAPGDRFLLCSDGLHGYLRPGEAAKIVLEKGAEASKTFIDMANDRGGKDNITAIVVEVGEKPPEMPTETTLKIEVLRHAPLFKHLDYQELVKVLNITILDTYKEDEVLIEEGQSGDEFYVILNGQVEVSKEGVTLTHLSDGDHVGELALIERVPRTATVKAVMDTKVLAIHRADFYDLIRKEPILAVKLLWIFLKELSSRLRQTNEELTILLTGDLDEGKPKE